MDQFRSVARIFKTRGIRGEVVAELLTDFPERFSSLREVRIFKESQEYREEIERYWFQKGRVVLKFSGRDTPEDAKELIGGEIGVSESERTVLPEDTYYYSDLVDCSIREEGVPLGQVTGIFETGPSGCNLVANSPDGREFMIPLVKEFIVNIDVEGKVIEVNLPPGLTSGV